MRESRTPPPPAENKMHYQGVLVRVVRRGEKWGVEPAKFCRDCGELLRGEQDIKDGQCWECWLMEDVHEEDFDDDD